ARKTPDSISPAGATAWLRNRAALAGAATSADTPVVPAINDDVDRILQRTMAAAHETVSASASIKPGPENAIARLSRTLEVLRDIPRERPARNSTREFAPARPRTILQDQEHSQQHQ